MARTSKKKTNIAKVSDRAASPPVYSVGIYARLSVDGDEQKNESIETQIEIAKAFVSRQNDMVICGCYTDIGKTGTNFQREGFARMMRDVKMRKINCIIVKDLSRFGRNHIEIGNYIEKIFPFLGVRFIAVTDGFDSMNVSGKNETLSVNLKNLVNEMYAGDISRKVKSSRSVKREQGSYIGGVAPYGYRVEWIGDKRCLLIEEEAAEVVKKIFHFFLSGKSIKQIAVWLYEKQIVRPAQYHKSGKIYWQEGCELLQWQRGTIKMILTNPVYMGWLVWGSTVKKHTHEAIISEDIFFWAAEKFETGRIFCKKIAPSGTVPTEEDLFSDVLYCGSCGAKMKRVTRLRVSGSKEPEKTYSYHCPNHNRIDARRCIVKSVPLSDLTKLAGTAIRQELALSDVRLKDLIQINDAQARQKKKEYDRKLARLERRVLNITKIESEQYMKYRMGELSEEAFFSARRAQEKRMSALQKKQEDIAERQKAVDIQTLQINDLVRCLFGGEGKTELTAEVVRTLIHRIEVYPDHRMKIVFAFQRRTVSNGEEVKKDETVSDCHLYASLKGG